MGKYVLTEDEKALADKLGAMRNSIKTLSNLSGKPIPEQFRSYVNRNLPAVRKAVEKAGCLKNFNIAPPSTVGGPIMQNIDPFDHIFDSPYGLSLNDSIIDMIEQTLGVLESGEFGRMEITTKSVSGVTQIASNHKIFVVHGHDESAKESAARFLEHLALDPIILHERASEGRTIIEKVEHYSSVSFCVVLLTPDDEGCKQGKDMPLLARARQNVVLELGYFMGKLGRNRVVALVRGEVERPSDVDGVVYITMDEGGAWKFDLVKELRAAGFEVDLNKAVR